MGGDDFSKKGGGIIERAVAKASTDILAAAKKLRAEVEAFRTFVTNEFFESAQVEEMVHEAIERGDNGVLLRSIWSRDAIVGAAELNDKIFQHQVKNKHVANAEIGFFDIEAAVVDRLIREGATKATVRKSCFSEDVQHRNPERRRNSLSPVPRKRPLQHRSSPRIKTHTVPIVFCRHCSVGERAQRRMHLHTYTDNSLSYSCDKHSIDYGLNSNGSYRATKLIIWHFNPYGLGIVGGKEISHLGVDRSHQAGSLYDIDREFFFLYVD